MENSANAQDNAFVPIGDADRIEVWSRPIPLRPGEPDPVVWLLGPHGGAGVTTLCRQLGIAGDARGAWPSGAFLDHESPMVLLVAAETRTGLDAMSRALRQHMAGQGSRAELLGLVTVAQERKRPRAIEHDIKTLATAGVPMWHVPFVHEYRLHFPHELPVWDPDGPAPEKGRRKPGPMEVVPPAIAEVGAAIDAYLDTKFSDPSFNERNQ